MTMPALAQFGVVLLRPGVFLHTAARPVIERVAQRLIAGVSHHYHFPLATSPRHRSRSRIIAQSLIISFSEGLRSLSEHRGGDDRPNSRQGKQDLCVTMLAPLALRRHRA